MNIEQVGESCKVTLGGETRWLKNCNALKLENALYGRGGEKYTNEEMYYLGFKLGSRR